VYASGTRGVLAKTANVGGRALICEMYFTFTGSGTEPARRLPSLSRFITAGGGGRGLQHGGRIKKPAGTLQV
jgi:hypothetical protein